MRLLPLLLSGPVLLRPLVLPLAVAALAAGWSVPAAADVWAYVDARGESHFATEQLDERYELFFRSAEIVRHPARSAAIRACCSARPPWCAGNALPTNPLAGAVSTARRASSRYARSCSDASSDHNIDYELLQALIATESGFNASAVSPKGAIGLMQLMPDTARRYGVDTDRHGRSSAS